MPNPGSIHEKNRGRKLRDAAPLKHSFVTFDALFFCTLFLTMPNIILELGSLITKQCNVHFNGTLIVSSDGTFLVLSKQSNVCFNVTIIKELWHYEGVYQMCN